MHIYDSYTEIWDTNGHINCVKTSQILILISTWSDFLKFKIFIINKTVPVGLIFTFLINEQVLLNWFLNLLKEKNCSEVIDVEVKYKIKILILKHILRIL